MIDPARDAPPPAALRFDAPVALIGGGAASADDIRAARRRSGAVIAADSGADHFEAEARAGARPLDAIIGDMDSIGDRALWRRTLGRRFLEIDEQDTTDFEKCLYSVDAPLFIGAGFFGRRLDHSLAAFNTLLRRADRRVILIGEEEVAFLAPLDWRAELAPGARVSIVPIGPSRGRASEGLRWPIDGLDFALGAQIGTSNEAVAERVSARFDRIGAVILLEKQYLDAAVASIRRAGAWRSTTGEEGRP